MKFTHLILALTVAFTLFSSPFTQASTTCSDPQVIKAIKKLENKKKFDLKFIENADLFIAEQEGNRKGQKRVAVGSTALMTIGAASLTAASFTAFLEALGIFDAPTIFAASRIPMASVVNLKDSLMVFAIPGAIETYLFSFWGEDLVSKDLDKQLTEADVDNKAKDDALFIHMLDELREAAHSEPEKLHTRIEQLFAGMNFLHLKVSEYAAHDLQELEERRPKGLGKLIPSRRTLGWDDLEIIETYILEAQAHKNLYEVEINFVESALKEINEACE